MWKPEIEKLVLLAVVSLMTILQHNTYSCEELASNIKPNSDDNFIITHYGTERYTPVSDEDMHVHNFGYFKSEVIPVDPISGDEITAGKEQWNPINDIFVPLHTGYSIGVEGEVKDSHETAETNLLQYSEELPPVKIEKNKRKKYKEKTIYGFANKPIKELYYFPEESNESLISDNSKGSIKKRHISHIPETSFFPRKY